LRLSQRVTFTKGTVCLPFMLGGNDIAAFFRDLLLLSVPEFQGDVGGVSPQQTVSVLHEK
jgi:hypothetical protein